MKTEVHLITEGSLRSHRFEYIELKQEDKSKVPKIHTQHFQSKKENSFFLAILTRQYKR